MLIFVLWNYLIPRIPTLIPRIPIIPLIPFLDSPFRLLQIALEETPIKRTLV